MSRALALAAGVVALVALIAAIVLLTGGGDEAASPSPTPTGELQPPNDGATPPSAGALPREFLECMADRGFEIDSQADIHSAPPQVLQACFGALHGGSRRP